jgi:hypothetical protein
MHLSISGPVSSTSSVLGTIFNTREALPAKNEAKSGRKMWNERGMNDDMEI